MKTLRFQLDCVRDRGPAARRTTEVLGSGGSGGEGGGGRRGSAVGGGNRAGGLPAGGWAVVRLRPGSVLHLP